MHELHFDFGIVDMSDEIYSELSEVRIFDDVTVDYVEYAIRFILDESLKRIDRYKKPETIRILDAHGDSYIDGNGKRHYDYFDKETDSYENGHFNPVSEWVKENDGEYEALIVLSCNPGFISLRTENSLLLYPLGIVYPKDMNNTNFRVFTPYPLASVI